MSSEPVQVSGSCAPRSCSPALGAVGGTELGCLDQQGLCDLEDEKAIMQQPVLNCACGHAL